MKSSMKNKNNDSSKLYRFWKILSPGLVIAQVMMTQHNRRQAPATDF